MYSIEATPFSEENAQGDMGMTSTLILIVVVSDSLQAGWNKEEGDGMLLDYHM